LFVLLGAAMFMVYWSLVRLNPNKQPPPFWLALNVSFGGSLFFVYVMTWVISLCPAYIRMYEKWICRTVANSNQLWRFSDIRSYSWRDCTDYDVLVLEHRTNKQVLIGVPRRVPRPPLEEFLATRGLKETCAQATAELARPA
jgi:hypothetical protein